MPIYAFRCALCGHDFDRLQKLSDADPDTCPACGASGGVGRQLTAPAFRLAGSGWYETDFKKDGDKKRNLAEGGEGAGKAESGTAAGDAPAKTNSPAAPAAPPAAKPEAKPAAAKPDAG
ncbi:FmdB family zinc ribbon protein [Luteimonas sp. A501]